MRGSGSEEIGDVEEGRPMVVGDFAGQADGVKPVTNLRRIRLNRFACSV